MYAERWSPRLRQGDIFGEVDFPFSKAGYARVFDASSIAATGEQAIPTQLQIGCSRRFAIVTSHDCEFNERKRIHFLVARIETLSSGGLEAEQMEELRRGNDIAATSESGNPIALDTFFLEPLDGVFEEPQRVNFASITPFPMKAKTDLLKLKRAELQHEHRVMLREKLAAFFARVADDIPDEAKVDVPADPQDLEWQDIEVVVDFGPVDNAAPPPEAGPAAEASS
jgi:hypothetical protein